MCGQSARTVSRSAVRLKYSPARINEQRRRIDASVIAGERHLAQSRHFAIAHFVQYLTGRGVTRRINRGRLGCGQKAKHPLGDRGIDPQGEQGGQQPVASKRRAEPGYPGKRVRPLLGVGDQHVQIRDRAARYLIEQRVRAVEACRTAARCLQRAARGAQRSVKPPGDAFALSSRIAGHAQDEPRSLLRPKRQVVNRGRGIETGRRRLERQGRDALHAVQAEISYANRGLRAALGRDLPAAGSLLPPHLEKIGEIGGELDAERHRMGTQIEISDEYALVIGGIPNEFEAVHMD